MNRSAKKACWLVLLTALALSGCGFKPRGSVALPAYMDTVAIRAGNPNSELVRSLRRQLQASGTRVVPLGTPDVTIVNIFRDGFERRVLSVGSTGKAQEYEVHYTTSFSVNPAGGGAGIQRQNLNLSRDFVFDEREVLSKASEESLVRRTLQKDMVRQILLRMQAAAR